MDTGKIRLTTLVVAIVTVVGVEMLARALVTTGVCSPLVAVLYARLVEAVLLLVGIRLWQKTLGSVGLGRGDLIRGFKTGFAWAIIFGGIVAATGTLLLAAGENPVRFFGLPRNGNSLFVYFLAGSVVSPFVEELFFRGVLYGFFRRWGVVVALTLTTIVFAGLHLSVTDLPITQVIGGIVFCLAYEKGKSLMAPYVIHVMGNGAIFGLGLFSQRCCF